MTRPNRILSPIPAFLMQLVDAVRDHDSGERADYIPQLASADPTPLALAMCTTTGRLYAAGDCDVEFTMQSISKPFVYALALQECGIDTVEKTVGLEPSGEAFNELSLEGESKRPMNPMINAGAIAVNQLINGEDSTVEDRVEVIIRLMSRLAGRTLAIDEELAASELTQADRNLSIAHMLRSYGIIHDEAHDAVLSYTRQCAIKVTARDLAVMAATLSNGGTNPITDALVLDTRVCRQVVSMMSSAGMYNGAGRWMARIGIPAKSGVSGGLLGALPGQLGLATFSPRLDAEGNSVRGRLLFERLSDEMGLHLMNPDPVGAHAIRSINSYGADTIINLQGLVNFAAAEQIINQIGGHDFADGRVILDVTRVVAIEAVGRQLLSRTLQGILNAGFDIAVYDPENRLPDLKLSDGTLAPTLDAEQRREAAGISGG